MGACWWKSQDVISEPLIHLDFPGLSPPQPQPPSTQTPPPPLLLWDPELCLWKPSWGACSNPSHNMSRDSAWKWSRIKMKKSKSPPVFMKTGWFMLKTCQSGSFIQRGIRTRRFTVLQEENRKEQLELIWTRKSSDEISEHFKEFKFVSCLCVFLLYVC